MGGIFLGEEVEGVESLGLRFGDGGYVRGPWQTPVAREAASGVLNDQALGLTLYCWLVMKQGPGAI